MANPLEKYQGAGVGGSEETKKAEIIPDKLSELAKKYYETYKNSWSKRGSLLLHKLGNLPILTPDEISMLARILPTEQLSNEFPYTDGRSVRYYTGEVLNKLIQCSYDEGYNGFTIDTACLTPIPALLGNGLKGRLTKPLKLNIIGELPLGLDNRLRFVRHVDCTLDDIDYLGHEVKYCILRLRNEPWEILTRDPRKVSVIGFEPIGPSHNIATKNILVVETPNGEERIYKPFMREDDNTFKRKPYKEPGKIRRILSYIGQFMADE